jgi:hypothetical protein
MELGNTCQIESKIFKVLCRNRYIGFVLIGFMPAYGALCKAHAKGGQTLEEQGKISLNIIVIIHNNMNHVQTIKKRLQNPQKIEYQ